MTASYPNSRSISRTAHRRSTRYVPPVCADRPPCVNTTSSNLRRSRAARKPPSLARSSRHAADFFIAASVFRKPPPPYCSENAALCARFAPNAAKDDKEDEPPLAASFGSETIPVFPSGDAVPFSLRASASIASASLASDSGDGAWSSAPNSRPTRTPYIWLGVVTRTRRDRDAVKCPTRASGARIAFPREEDPLSAEEPDAAVFPAFAIVFPPRNLPYIEKPSEAPSFPPLGFEPRSDRRGSRSPRFWFGSAPRGLKRRARGRRGERVRRTQRAADARVGMTKGRR